LALGHANEHQKYNHNNNDEEEDDEDDDDDVLINDDIHRYGKNNKVFTTQNTHRTSSYVPRTLLYNKLPLLALKLLPQ